jgi:multiple sugar transport system substrate-binding protein
MTWDHRRAIEPLAALDAAFAKQRPDVQIAWRTRPLAGFEFDPIERLAAENDFVIFDHPFCGRIATTGCFLSVSALLDDAGGAGAFVGPSVASYRLRDGHWGVPVDAACQVAVCRPDLMAQAGFKPPTTWEEACTLGEAAARRGLSLAIGLHGVHALMTFFSLCASLGAPFTGEGDGGDVDEAVAGEALAQMRRLVASCHAPVLDWNSIALHEAMATSQTLVYCPAVYGYAAYGESDRGHRLAFGPFAGARPSHPCAGSTIGGAGLGISARVAGDRDVMEAALAYARTAASGTCQNRIFASHHGQPAHVDAWSDAAADERFNGFFSATRQTMEQSWIRPRYDGYLVFQAQAGDLVEAHLRGDLAERSLLDALRALDARCRASAPQAHP